MNDEFPVLPFRSTTYTAEELFAGFDPRVVGSYARTPDFAAYRSTRLAPSRDVGMLRALHDQCMNDARDEVLDGHRVVAIMGGHDLARTDPIYREVASLAGAFSVLGRLLVSGGGPGAMEATHLGALLARMPEGLDDALGLLGRAAPFPDSRNLVGAGGVVDEGILAAVHAWQRPAFELLEQVPIDDRGPSLSIPTWFYGHEPPTPFATSIAKYFSNPIREDGLLAVAADGIVFAPGRAGTLQEVFQDAAQNYYRDPGRRFSPMAFYDVDGCWTETFPVAPILTALFGPDDYRQFIRVTPDPDEIVDFVTAST